MRHKGEDRLRSFMYSNHRKDSGVYGPRWLLVPWAAQVASLVSAALWRLISSLHENISIASARKALRGGGGVGLTGPFWFAGPWGEGAEIGMAAPPWMECRGLASKGRECASQKRADWKKKKNRYTQHFLSSFILQFFHTWAVLTLVSPHSPSSSEHLWSLSFIYTGSQAQMPPPHSTCRNSAWYLRAKSHQEFLPT